MMDYEIRKSGLAGNFCSIILELDGIPDSIQLRQKCTRFAKRFPQATARIKSSGRQYLWSASPDGVLPFYEHTDTQSRGNTGQGVSSLMTTILNKSTPKSETAPVELHLVAQEKTSQLVLRWFHPACDAKGAELILYYLFQDTGRIPDHSDSVISQIMNQWSWWKTAKLGYASRKNIRRLDRYSSIIPVINNNRPDHVNTSVIRYNQQDSSRIFKLARHHVGLSGIALYFIGCMMRSLEKTGEMKPADAYCVPYAINLRKRKSLAPVFGNQVSFLFAQAEQKIVQTRSSLFTHLREQSRQAVKQGLDRAMLPLMLAGSWLSLEKYGKIVRTSPAGLERSSFWFSYTGGMDPESEEIIQCPVTGMYQFTQLTSPPSLGLLVNNFQNRVTLSFNYVNNQFGADWLDEFFNNMKAELLECE